VVYRLLTKWSGLENILDPERKPDRDKHLGRRIILEIFLGVEKKRAEHVLELRIRDMDREKHWKYRQKIATQIHRGWSKMNAVGKLR
jgi:hypothetical protein